MNLLALWIWISAAASAAGWILSASGQLNRPGFVVFGLVTAFLLFYYRREVGLVETGPRRATGKRWTAWRRRFRRPLPLCFAILVLLIFISGILYAPSNHTALSYRTPRVLHWLAEGHWHWIHTPNYRMNDRACGIEWLSAPLFLFFRSDRLIFLLNFVPYLFLPGLIFNLCRSVGVCGRVAWQWMWILPTGYSFLLQAGSAGNDTFPTIYGLAAVCFAVCAWKSRAVSDLWLSALSAALLTGAKASNLPLLLPWAILLLPILPLFRRDLIGTVVLSLLCLLVSFLPTAILNVHYCGDWSGLKMENVGMNMKNPFVGIWGNLFLLLLNNFVPPFFPLAGWWNQHALSLLPQAMVAPMQTNFEAGFHILGELPTEDWVGLGLGASLLALVSFVASGFYRRRFPSSESCTPSSQVPVSILKLFLLTPWIALLAYCAKSGMVTAARLISPYYPLLLLLILALPGQALVVRRRWWNVLVALVMLTAFPVLMLTPGRPLWPAQTILARLHQQRPESRTVARALEVYRVYSTRPDPLAPVRALLPTDANVVGFMAAEDDIDVSLWRPFGQRVVKHILVTDSLEEIRRRGIRYAVVGGFNLKLRGIQLEDWLARNRGEVIGTTVLTIKVAEGPQPWYVVKLAAEP